MKKFVKVSIGIPAYNEESNISYLINSLLKQKIKNGKILEIIICSDGSKDKTVELVNSFADKRIKVYKSKNRVGQNLTQNKILRLATGDILILLNGDVLPEEHFFIQHIIKPFLTDSKVGLVGADTISVAPKTILERVIGSSHEFKKAVFRKIKHGHTIYLCHGRARAFSKDFYSQLSFEDDCPEDAFSYLTCLSLGFKFVFAKQAKVYFRSPANFSDHAKQSIRFLKGVSSLKKYFDPNLIKAEYSLPKSHLLKNILSFLISHPFEALAYFITSLYIRTLLTKKDISLTKWEIAKSSKEINYAK